jgi:hypothetical protein
MDLIEERKEMGKIEFNYKHSIGTDQGMTERDWIKLERCILKEPFDLVFGHFHLHHHEIVR